ncbi:MAG TPA: NAD-dependent epimerase/dehydratase family protein [Candidatus Lokiarchaeia archaeon]|nr:NAD-dependent epimerase/dehydratase family protein [Candidatus Lokiarchaeia archaeon]
MIMFENHPVDNVLAFFKDKRVLVTGAGGFIGSHLSRWFYNNDVFVRAVDIKWDDFIKDQYFSEKNTLDLRYLDNCMKAVEDIDFVFNFAANMGGIGFITSVGAEVMYDNVLINTYMAKASVDCKVQRFFFSSSACVYPTYKQTVIDVTSLKESDAIPADPDNYYGWEKIFTEKVLEAFTRDCNLDVRIARFHNIYGPEGTYKGGREKSPAALCRKVAEASDPGEIEIWGDGNQTRSYCYIDDCLEGILRLMVSVCRDPLNIGSDRLISINDLAEMIIEISGKTILKTHDLDAPQGVRGRNSDNTELRRVLNWEPRTSLEEGIKNTYSWIESMVAIDAQSSV